MKVYKGVSASPGLVLGQVSRLEHHVETFSHGPFNPERELRLLANAVHTAQNELDSMAERAAPTEQAIFLFQSMMLDDEGMMNEVRFCINAGISASAAMHQVGQRYADQLANMKDNPYMQLRSVDILDATRRVINILTNRPRVWLALDHPVILAADRLMPTDLFSVPSGMILGVITAEGSGQSHAAIIARAMNIPGIVQVGKDFLDDCDGRTVILDATNGNCILDPDAAARQQAEASICQLQREDAEMKQLHSLPDETRDGEPFELLANCFGPEDIDTAMQSGAKGVGLLRSGYMMLPGRILDEQEQYFFYCSCLAAANGCPVTVRTFDFGSDRTVADANQGPQSSKLGLRGIRNSLRQPQQFQTQICALLRAAARGPLRVMFPMVTDVEDWDAAMSIVEHCRQSLRERGVPFNENTQFGVMLSIPAACLTVEDFVAHGCDFLVIGTNDLTQYTHAADRELASAEHYYRPASPAMKKLITMVMDAASAHHVPVTICGLAVGNPANTAQYLHLGLRSFSVSPQNLLKVKRALLNRWLPLVPFVCYPVLLVLLNLRWFTMLTIGRGGGALDFMQVIARAILVPGLAFGLGTILRARLNFPRPYEQPGFVPLVSKETHGNSCPSRHALSAAVLGMVWLYFYPAVGVVMLTIAALICLLRVLSGAHFVRDVLAGAAFGLTFGFVGMWLL